MAKKLLLEGGVQIESTTFIREDHGQMLSFVRCTHTLSVCRKI